MDKYKQVMASVYVCNFCGTSFISAEQAESCFDEDIQVMRVSNDRYVDELSLIHI